MASKIFLTYSRKDKAFAKQVSSILFEEGFQVWSDEKIRAGENWDDSLRKAMEESAYFIVLVSENFKQSANAIFELSAAYALGKKIIPISIHGEINGLPWMLKNSKLLDGRKLQKNALLQAISDNPVRAAA